MVVVRGVRQKGPRAQRGTVLGAWTDTVRTPGTTGTGRPARSGSRGLPSVVLEVDGHAVGPVEPAHTYLRRLRGMTGRRRLPPALLLVPGGAVHGIGMTVALDVAMLVPAAGDPRRPTATPRAPAWLGRTWEVRRAARLAPFGLVLGVPGVGAVLEAPAGAFAAWGLGPGSRVATVAVPLVPADPGGTREQ